jgi:MoaA/NifB/PqqE/SkfB family radical SAM enzyme
MKKDKNLSKRMSLRPTISDFFNLGKDVLFELDKIMDYKILKLSGGEIFLYNDIVNFVKSIHKNYAAVQLLTNGMALTTEKIDQLARLGNVYFQISLDGASGARNFARNGNDKVVDTILKNAKRILKNGMGLEINCVLTKYNTGFFGEMLEYFRGAKNFVIVPRPVRGEPRAILDFDKDQARSFKELVIDKYQPYSDILPPKQYLERLVFLMQNGHRDWGCYVPFYVMGVNNYGDVHTCTRTGDLPIVGNIFNDPKRIDKIFKEYKSYIPEEKHEPCSYCIIQYEMMNLYSDGLIRKSELEKIPSFKIPGVLERVEEIKKRLIDLKILE